MRVPEIKRLHCPACKRAYQSSQVAILGIHGEDYLVKCSCTCGTMATFLIQAIDPANIKPAISVDDVLAAHTFLEAFKGTLSDLFEIKKELPPETKTEPFDGMTW